MSKYFQIYAFDQVNVALTGCCCFSIFWRPHIWEKILSVPKVQVGTRNILSISYVIKKLFGLLKKYFYYYFLNFPVAGYERQCLFISWSIG